MNWDDLEEPLYRAPAFYIQPPDKAPESELKRVVAFRKALREALPQARAVAVPNAAKRGQIALNTAKAEGAVWGFPDLLVLYQGRVAFLEFKNGKGKPASHQIDQMNWLCDNGYDVACVRTAQGALDCLRSWGWPI